MEPDKTNASKSSLRARLTSRRGILTLAVIALLLLGIVAYLIREQDDRTDSTPVTALSESAAVSVTEDGLSPASITVKVGTQLTWSNDDEVPHQMSADPHPLHDSVNGFDSETVLQPGESQSFTFEKTGTYTFHDHLNPLESKWQGTVIVE